MEALAFMNQPSVEKWLSLPTITLDVETTNLRFGDSLHPDNKLILTCYKEQGGVTSVWGDTLALSDKLLNTLEGDVLLVGHNIKFDLRWLAKAGLDLSKVMVWDTMLAEKVLLGNNPANKALSLDAVAKRRGFKGKEPVIDVGINMGVCPSLLPHSLLQRRCEYDVHTTEAIMLQQREEAIANGKVGVVLTRCILTPVLADIETNGLFLDRERVYEEYNKAKVEYADVCYQLGKISDINWGSGKQKGKALYTTYKFKELRKYGKPVRTPAGAPVTDIDTIKALKATTKIQKKIQHLLVEQSSRNAQLTKALNKFKACVDNDDLLYAQFNQHITVTHRLSSNGTEYRMQLQNIAREFKRIFTTRHKDWLYCEADGSNLEFRVAVELGDDEQGRIDIADPKFDAHDLTADTLTEAGQYTERQDAKQHTFKPLYGGSSGTEAEKTYYKSFKARYGGITKVQEGWLDEAYRNKSVVLPWGMEFFFPNTKFTRSGYQTDSTSICNYPVQSFATADIIPIAMTYLWLAIKDAKLQAFMVNTVHDSVELEAPKEEREEIDELICHSFSEVCYNYLYRVYNYNFKTPLGVGIKWGTHWGEGEEKKYDIPNENN